MATFAPVRSSPESPLPKLASSRLYRAVALGFTGLVLAALFVLELKSSWLESRLLATVARHISFSLGSGASQAIRYPRAGPYDLRLGYSRLPDIVGHLQAVGFGVKVQPRDSKLYLLLAKLYIYAPYREKDQAGLAILGREGRPLYRDLYPTRVYSDFSEVPALVVSTLLFIENREILDSHYPYRNPTIDWGRLSRAVVDFGVHAIDRSHPVTGGSTLATQLEKIRHSPEGRTDSLQEKLRQMAAASLRAYHDGPETLTEQRRIVRDYINSLPLAAFPAQGEVSGLGDGLWTWYGTDFTTVDGLLNAREENLDAGQQRRRARAYRQVLSLILAARAPNHYLVRDPKALATQTDRYLRALCTEGIISTRLRNAALVEHADLLGQSVNDPRPNFISNKASGEVRAALLPLLGLGDTYSLDRLDLSVNTTIDETAQQSATRFLASLKDPQQTRSSGLQQYQLLSQDDPRSVIYSFVLYERVPGANLLRVQTDNYNQPLDINKGTKLELGSTAKLRTLVNYLQIAEQLHDRYAGLSLGELQAVEVLPDDHLTEWAISYLSAAKDRSLTAMLQAAVDRHYSANPDEAFFTAGGLHEFANFDPEENGRIMTVGEAFEQSVNLVFIRLMRDIKNYYTYRVPFVPSQVLTNRNDPARHGYLARFADEEGRVFLANFYQKYKGQTPDHALEMLVTRVHPTAQRAAVIYRSVRPKGNLEQFSGFLQAHLPRVSLQEKEPGALYQNYEPDRFGLADRGYLAHVHPLELWLLNYLDQHPQATLEEMIAESTNQRQEVYEWLFRTRNKNGQDRAIRIILEQDAFKEIWRAWKQQGYPFDSLVPSYATAIGVSGDMPEALAELVGILMNGGVRYPRLAISEMHFAQNTPMETVLEREPARGERVLSPEIAALVRQELIGVVEKGTARRARGGIHLRNGVVIPIGGKTGTGDNRFKVFAPGGRLVSSQAVNRTAAFVFMVGDRFFGTVLAFVPGKSAVEYEFTSALAVQVFKDLEPTIEPLMEEGTSQEALSKAQPINQRGPLWSAAVHFDFGKFEVPTEEYTQPQAMPGAKPVSTRRIGSPAIEQSLLDPGRGRVRLDVRVKPCLTYQLRLALKRECLENGRPPP